MSRYTFFLALALSAPVFTNVAVAQPTPDARTSSTYEGTISIGAPQLGDPAGPILLHVTPIPRDNPVLIVQVASGKDRDALLAAAKSGQSVSVAGTVAAPAGVFGPQGPEINVTSVTTLAIGPRVIAAPAKLSFVGTISIGSPELGNPAGPILLHQEPVPQENPVVSLTVADSSNRAALLDAAKTGRSVEIEGTALPAGIGSRFLDIEVTDLKVLNVGPRVVTATPAGGFDKLSLSIKRATFPGNTETLSVDSTGKFELSTVGGADKLVTVKTGQLTPADLRSLEGAFKRASHRALPATMPGIAPDAGTFSLSWSAAGKETATGGSLEGAHHVAKGSAEAKEWAALAPLLTKLEVAETKAQAQPTSEGLSKVLTDKLAAPTR